MNWLADARESYDTVATSYATLMRDALADKPFLRAALGLVGPGPVVDVGCGPGHVAGYVHGRGASVGGLDLSPGMIEEARRRYPTVPFAVASMTALPLADDSAAAILAWWTLIHIPDETIPTVLAEFRRVLRPGGTVQIGFHVGDETRLKTSGYGGHPMRINVHRRRPEQMAAWLRAAGFRIDATLHMLPDEDPSQAVLFAGTP
ncbi:class I SAM-dependent methyltransferase [Actinokineospora enzanensis]|uniref:class I SAM-dependent methyltransferase n=1 Tax=Actinokineospora enzanensis TaxID=155975 RepID=UPI00037FB119|nr:class I SAM-dependent methyltransferase [Actinokineospora enzanensis]